MAAPKLPKPPTKRPTVKAVTSRAHETRDTRNFHGSRTATEKRVGESAHKVPTFNMKKIAEASSLRTFRAGERPASRMKVASLKVPENDKQGYGYGRGKGTPTFNMKKSGVAASLREHRASERASAQKITGRSTATSVRRKAPGLMAPPKKGATVGDAMWAVNRGIQGALKASPGLKSKGIQNVMKLPPKRK